MRHDGRDTHYSAVGRVRRAILFDGARLLLREIIPHRDRQPTDRGLWLEASPSLSDPRSGCLLRRHIRPTRSLAWHSRSSDLCTFTLAERICGAPDRFDPKGMPRPYCCGRRTTPAPHPHVLHGVLQLSPNASLIRQGCASSTAHSARCGHRSAACPWWAAPSIRADLICGRDRQN